MTQSAPTRWRRTVTALVSLALGAGGLATLGVAAPAHAAPGDTAIALLEVENGTITGGPALNSGEHGNFSGSGSYTFREAGMRSTMSVTVPEAGSYPVWIRYAAGALTPAENDRKMGLLVNAGVAGESRQLVDYPLTGDWETWAWAPATVTLKAGSNTIAVDCQRSASGTPESCRLNFDAIQVGGTAPDTCVATTAPQGAAKLFDGTFASFDQWRKSGGGGFGRQADCSLRGFRGPGVTWTRTSPTQMANAYTLGVDWRRTDDADAASSIYVGATAAGSTAGAHQVMIGATDSGTITSADGSFTQAADAAAVAAAVKSAGQWNRFSVQVTTRGIRVLLNGKLVNSAERSVTLGGFVGLENRSTAPAVDFRDITVVPGATLGQLAQPIRRATLADGTTVNPGGESSLANLVADSQRWAMRGFNARLALVSPTSLTADLTGSSLTEAQAVAAVADEKVVTMRLTGAALKAILEQQWQPGGSARPFVRLGSSSTFTWTQDATRPAGDRITSMSLDGAPLSLTATGNIPVAVPAALAAGGDGFTAFSAGTGRTNRSSTVAALADYLAMSSAAGPITAPKAQVAVDVHVPGGAPTSYVAGTEYAVDLASWSYAGAGDPVDATVQVSVGNRAIGTFTVDNTVSDDPTDLHGRVAVRATLPVDLPAGAATVRIVGTTTGTTVSHPIVVTAAPTTPTPEPEPEPEPTPEPTPNPTPPPNAGPTPSQPAPSKSRAVVKVAVKPGTVVAQRTRAKLKVTVRSGGATPTGMVTVRIGKQRLEKKLSGGRVTIWLPVLRAGATRVSVSYGGDARTLTTTRTLRINAVRR